MRFDRAGVPAAQIRDSVRLTPFGQDFCDVCLPLDPVELESLTED